MRYPFQIFEDVVVPLFYPADSESLWKIDTASINALNRGLVGELTSSSVHSTPKRTSSSSSSSSSFSSPSSSPKRSIVSLAGGAGGKSLTYGEVIPSSIERHVIPQLGLRNGDVVVDLGSGTGKIPLQIALYSQVNGINVRCKGIELAHERHAYAERAYNGLSSVTLNDVSQQLEVAGQGSSSSSALVSALHQVASKVEAIEGDLLFADLTDVTVIFVNNTVFDPALMIKLSELLADRTRAPKLRKLVLLRALCCRHSSRCEKLNSACCAFEHPPIVTICHPTWCNETTLFTYNASPTWTRSQRWTAMAHEPQTPVRFSTQKVDQKKLRKFVEASTLSKILMRSTPTASTLVSSLALGERRKRKMSDISRDLSDGVDDLMMRIQKRSSEEPLSLSSTTDAVLLQK